MIKSDGQASEDLAIRPGIVAINGFVLTSLNLNNLKMLTAAYGVLLIFFK
jgi:hypothetical protein